MSMTDTKLRFTEDHEWLRIEGGEAVVGISTYAQETLGDIVFVELPKVGDELEAGAEAAVVESVKAASELYAPVSGKVTAVNQTLEGNPGLVNIDPMGDGWLYRLALSDASAADKLMDEEAYQRYVGGLG
jgi:glycine cleavage system H protein